MVFTNFPLDLPPLSRVFETVGVVLNTKPAENATNPNGLKTVWEAAHGSVRRLPSMALPTDPLPDCQPTPN